MEQIEHVVRAAIESTPTSWTEYVSVICLVLTLLVAAFSALYAKKSYVKHEARSKKEAACNLAKMYADEFLPKFQYVSTVMSNAGLLTYVKTTFPLDELEHFDEQEMNAILEKYENLRTDADKKHNEVDPTIIYVSAQFLFEDIIDSEIIKCTNNPQAQNIPQLNQTQKRVLRTRFNLEISRLLNWLEWFSLNARYGIVDEEILFQSLHQTFISSVWQFYYFIAKSNKNSPGDKYYTNTIWLFLKWKDRLNSIKAEAESKKAAVHNGIRDAEYVGTTL